MELNKEDKKFIQMIIKGSFAFVVILSIFFAVKIASEAKNLRLIGANITPANTISFEGQGEMSAVPDVAVISFSVRQDAKTMKEAQDVVSKKITEVLDFLEKTGIAKKDIKTLNYSSYPKYEYPESRPCTQFYCPPVGNPKVSGFEVSQNIDVKVRDTEKVSKILDVLASIGVTDISGPNFSIDDEQKLKDESRLKAIKNAKVKAESLAKDLGINLGRIVNFYEAGNYPIYGGLEMKAMSADSGGAAPAPELPLGENKFISNVTITYEIR